jgi:homotetrameric cytidine deaminase
VKRARPRVSSADAELLAAARAAAQRAYAPYSGFCVGAALRSAAGRIHTGCNVENASYGLTTCAERNAVAAAVAAEGAGLRIVALAVAVDAAEAFAPCGACRQVVAEFAAADAVVLYAGAAGRPARTTMRALLPGAFRLR